MPTSRCLRERSRDARYRHFPTVIARLVSAEEQDGQSSGIERVQCAIRPSIMLGSRLLLNRLGIRAYLTPGQASNRIAASHWAARKAIRRNP